MSDKETPEERTKRLLDPNVETLPDSRARELKGAMHTPMGWHRPTFCPSCGIEGPLCLEENMTFFFWICDDCYAKYGHITSTLAIPDEVFYEIARQEMLEKHGRVLDEREVDDVVTANASPLARLLIEKGR